MERLTKAAALVLALLMAAFLAYIFAGSTPPGVKRPRLSLAATAGNAKVKFASYKDCRKCHPQIYKEWERSWHRMAWTDPWVQLSWGCYRDQECRACHLPRPLMEDGKKPKLVARSEEEDKDSGINCLTCHYSPQGILAPRGLTVKMQDGCYPIYYEDIATDAQCWECHPNQYDDWRLSSFFKEGKGCKACHMDEVERPIVPDGPVRKTRVHFWKGAHTYTFIKTAYDFSVDLKDEGVKVRVANTKSGHLFPAERHNRALWVEVTFYDDKGKQVGEMTKWIIREGSNQPRNMKLMQIKPDSAVERVFPYPTASGSVKVVLKFDYFYSNEDQYTRVLEDPPPYRFSGKKPAGSEE